MAIRIVSHYRVTDPVVACAALLHDAVEDHAAGIVSGGRCRAESPGEASARSSVATDSADNTARMRHCAQGPVQVHEEVGLCGMLKCAVRYLLGFGPVTDTVQGVGESAG